jgi:hypothetical protein
MASPASTFPSIGRAQSPRNTGRWVLAVTGTDRGYRGTVTRFWIDSNSGSVSMFVYVIS